MAAEMDIPLAEFKALDNIEKVQVQYWLREGTKAAEKETMTFGKAKPKATTAKTVAKAKPTKRKTPTKRTPRKRGL